MKSAGIVLVALTVAGCFNSGGPADSPERAPIANPPPPGCDPARPAVAHAPGGVPVDAPPSPVPIPCLTRTGERAFEPTIGITASGAVFVPKAVGDPRGAMRSLDEGASWELVVPTLADQPTHADSLDPFLYVDPATSRVFVDDLLEPGTCSILSWSDDDGETWEHSAAGCMETDHQHLFAGPPTLSPTAGYPNVVYRCAMNAGVGLTAASTCQRSLDGGMSWLPPGGPVYHADPTREEHLGLPCATGGNLGHGTVDARGRVSIAKGWCSEPWLAWSDDEGLTWTRVRVSDLGTARSSGHAFGIRTEDGSVDEADIGVDPAGDLYYAWIARDRLPYLTISHDDGATWSEPLMVTAPNVTEAALPALAVGGVGKVVISYMGSTNAPGAARDEVQCMPDPTNCVSMEPRPGYENVTWNGYITMTLDATASAPTFSSATVNDPSDPLWIGRCGWRCGPIMDFLDVAIAPDGTAWAPFVDACHEGICLPDSGLPPPFGEGDLGEGVVGRLWGGASLWDEEDPNGPYP